MATTTLPPLPLPQGVESSYIDTSASCGLVWHVLSSKKDRAHDQPLILLLHGAPELAFTWRHVIAPLASKGYYVVAPDQRGYGRTTGWDNRPFDEVDLNKFRMTNLVRDLVALVYALGYHEVSCIISHDFGTLPGTYAPLLRPDIFKSSIQVSIPFVAPPALGKTEDMQEAHRRTATASATELSAFALFEQQLESLNSPRMHYQWYNSQRSAANDWQTGGRLGAMDFMRGYLYLKSHDWPGNAKLSPPTNLTAKEMAVMPHYLLLSRGQTMPETVEMMLNGTDPSPSRAWISDQDLAVFVEETGRAGYQGELNWYRVLTSNHMARDVLLLAGLKMRVPTAFVTGANDWSSYLNPGAIDAYEKSCTDFRGVTVIPDCGHWVPEEQPRDLLDAVLSFLKSL